MIEEKELRGTGGEGEINDTAGGVKKGGTMLDRFAWIRLRRQGTGSGLVDLIDFIRLLGFNGKLGSEVGECEMPRFFVVRTFRDGGQVHVANVAGAAGLVREFQGARTVNGSLWGHWNGCLCRERGGL